MVEYIAWLNRKVNDFENEVFFKYNFYGLEYEELGGIFYLTNFLNGIELVFSSELILIAIHLFGKKSNGYCQFKGEIPFNLEFSFSCQDIYTIFGAPASSGDGENIPFLPATGFWVKYQLVECMFHLQFSEDKSCIELITLSGVS